MKSLRLFVLLVFIGFILYGCSENEKIFKITSGEINIDTTLQVELTESFLSDETMIGKHFPNEGFITANNKELAASYRFSNSTTMLIDLLQPLEPNTEYKVDINFKAIAKEHNFKPPLEKIQMKFKTKPTEFVFFDFKVQSKDNKAFVTAALEVSQEVSLNAIKEALKIILDNDKNLSFEIWQKEKGFFVIHSESITPSNTQDINVTLHIEPKFLGSNKTQETHTLTIPKNAELEALGIDTSEENTQPNIVVHFSQELAKTPNLKNYIQVTPDTSFNASQVGSTIILSGKFDFSTNYNIRILQGLKSLSGASLSEDKSFDITAREVMPSIAFSSSGVFVPRVANKKVAFKSVNVKKVTLELYRIYPNNLTQFLYDNNLIGDLDNNNASVRKCKNLYYEDDDYYEECSGGLDIERIGDKVLQKEFKLDSIKNQWMQNELDFSEVEDLSGIFIVMFSFNKDDVDYDFADMSDWRVGNFFERYAKISKHIIFSNIALLAHNLDKQFIVSAIDISQNTPIAGVQINAINNKNQIIESKTTNANGDANFSKVDTQNTLYFVAQNTRDLALLKLNTSLVSTDGFEVDGVVSSGGMRAFIYTERGVHRPGDMIFLNAIIRNDTKSLDSAHPVLLSVKTPRGKLLLDKQSMESSGDGFYHYEIQTPKNADTGVWEAILHIGDSVFKKELSIESVAPNRIKVLLDTPDFVRFNESNEIMYNIDSAYLFGTPASELEYSVAMNVRVLNFQSKLFKGYVFNVPSNLNFSHSDHKEGQLTSEGKANGTFSLESMERVNANLEASLLAKVYEHNGRFAATRKKVPITLFESFVGVKPLPHHYIETGQKVSLPVVVVANDDSKAISGHTISYTIYHNQYSWWWDYDSYSQYLRSIKTDKNTKVIAQGSLISKSEPVILEYVAKSSGEIYIEFKDESSGAVAGTSFYTTQWGEPLSAKKISSLKIKADKSRYNIGENAIVSFESTQGSKALVLLSKEDKILKRFWVDTKPNQTQITIPITADMTPNIYASVIFLQDYLKAQNDRSMRLYGVIPLLIDDRDSKLEYEISAPQSILPGSEFEIKLSTKQAIPSTYTLAIVDEGLLDLSDFKTPNPWQYFYSKIAFGLKLFDSYDLIVGKTFGKVHKILKIGGDEVDSVSYAKQKSDENAQRFKPVVLYNAPAKTDEKGKATLKFKMPSYIGSVRVMVVGANGKMYGSASTNIQVSAPVVMLPTIPRSLKIGDEFEMPIELFATQDSIKSAKVSVKSAKGIIKFTQDTQKVDFKDKKPKTIIFKAQVQNEVGVDTILLNLESSQGTLSDSTEIDIKPFNPFITTHNSYILKENEPLSIKAPKDFVKGTNQGVITLSANPLLNINHRVRWLVHYPYGCVEQTTSSVLPQLYLDKFGSFKHIDKKEIVKNINAGIARLGGFVTSSGGFSYWQGGREADAFGTHYAGHFLILAKKLGYYVPDSMFKDWLRYEKNFVKTSDNAGYKAYPLFLLALAQQPEIAVMNAIYENNLSKLSNTDKWLLGAAYKIAGYEDIARNITQNLSIKPNSSSAYYTYSYGSNLRDEAMILESYKIIYGTLHQTLFNSIKESLESNVWLSTQSSGYALLSLATTKDSQQEAKIKGSIEINGNKEKFSQEAQSINFDFAQGEAIIESTTPLYVAYSWEGVPLGHSIKAMSKGLKIERKFYNDSGEEIDVSTLKSASSFWIGLRVKSEKDRELTNVALTQSLPSGWEIENLRLNSDDIPSFVRNKGNIAYTDIRDDKIMWFFDLGYDNAWQAVVFVKINTITPGTYTLPTAYTEVMYDGNYQATTNTQEVKVLAK